MDIVARGLFQQTISGNLRRKCDSIFGGGKKFRLFFYWSSPAVEPKKYILSGNLDSLLQTKAHHASAPDAVLRMSADIPLHIRLYEFMQCCLIKDKEEFNLMFFLTVHHELTIY